MVDGKKTEDIHSGLENRRESSNSLMMTFACCFICYLFFGYTNDTVQEGDISKNLINLFLDKLLD
jgi:hypothetical protein